MQEIGCGTIILSVVVCLEEEKFFNNLSEKEEEKCVFSLLSGPSS